jgi:hypothetical protein
MDAVCSINTLGTARPELFAQTNRDTQDYLHHNSCITNQINRRPGQLHQKPNGTTHNGPQIICRQRKTKLSSKVWDNFPFTAQYTGDRQLTLPEAYKRQPVTTVRTHLLLHELSNISIMAFYSCNCLAC